MLILLFESEGPYKRLAKKWFNEDEVPHYGFYRHSEHVMLMKKAVKAVQGKTKGGIAEQESRINVSNVQLVCASCGKPSRIGHEIKGDRKVRVCKHCEAPMDK